MIAPRFGIAEWYGRRFTALSPEDRASCARLALDNEQPLPPCPFQQNQPPCGKRGGVCSIQRYRQDKDGRLGAPADGPVIVCPRRFEDGRLLVRWLAEIAGFAPDEAMVAREVPFMRGVKTDKAAGKIDLVVARDVNGGLTWYGLEIQAVYFSGKGMQSEFEGQLRDRQERPPFPNAVRRPDWRSSSAKRLMPQLQIKVPTLRRWASKIAVAVDRPFFDAVGGPSPDFSHNLTDGDIIWLVPELSPDETDGYRLSRGHWEVLTLEDSIIKLLAAETVQHATFVETLRRKLEPLA